MKNCLKSSLTFICGPTPTYVTIPIKTVVSLTMKVMEFETKISCSLLKSLIMDFF